MRVFYIDLENIGMKRLSYILRELCKKEDIVKIVRSRACNVVDENLEILLGRYSKLSISLISSDIMRKNWADNIIRMQLALDIGSENSIRDVFICSADSDLLDSIGEFVKGVKSHINVYSVTSVKGTEPITLRKYTEGAGWI